MAATDETKHTGEAKEAPEQVDPLAGGELAALVLLRDLLLAAPELRPLPPGMDVLGQLLHAGLLAGFHLLRRFLGLARVLGLIG